MVGTKSTLFFFFLSQNLDLNLNPGSFAQLLNELE